MTLHTNSNEDELVLLAQQGNCDAFTILYDRYFVAVYKRVYYRIPEQDVDDVVQDIFTAVLKSLKSFRGDAKFSTWLRTLVNRTIADFYRNRKPENLQFADHENSEKKLNPENHPALLSKNIDDLVMIRYALQKLPDNQREILLLRFAEGLRMEEIALQTGLSVEASKSLFRRSIAALRKHMEEVNA
jgi:RNA polymerase sigma-70 factor, ECF subfamily